MRATIHTDATWPCKLWGAPTVSKHAGMHALSLTLPKLHLATFKFLCGVKEDSGD